MRTSDLAAVVILLRRARIDRVWRVDHPWQQGGEQILLLVDEVRTVVVGQFVHVCHRQRARRAGLDAQATEDAPQVIDLVDAAIALTWGVALGFGVVGALDIDRVRRACPRAQLAADTLLQPVRMPVELVPAVESRRYLLLLLRVVLGVLLPEHRLEGDTEAGEGLQRVSHVVPPRYRRLDRWSPRHRQAQPLSARLRARPAP